MLSTPTHARANECGTIAEAAKTAIAACDTEIEHLKLLHNADQTLVSQLKQQRDDAFAAAAKAASSGVPWYVPMLVGIVAGGAGAVFIMKRLP